MNKEERIKKFKSMSSMHRQELILKKMKDKGIELGSGIPNKNTIAKGLWINSYCELLPRIKREKMKKI